jgi:uncharacterized RDD family membrane protein YckC
VLAGRGRRLGAVLIDGAIGFALIGLAAWLSPWNPWTAAAQGAVRGLLLNAAFGFAGFLVIHGWLLVNRGQTVGKALLGLRILNKDGSRATALQLFVMRYGVGTFVMVIPFVGNIYALVDALFIFRASRRCLHDLIAGTIVVTA